MDINEAAKRLFVSRPHVRRLLERGDITGTLTDHGGYLIDDASVENYAKKLSRAAKAYCDSQTDDDEPLGR